MLTTRAVPAVLFLVLAAGCASSDPAAAPAEAPAPSPSTSPSEVIDLPVPTAKTSGPAGEPTSGRPGAGAKTITGTVTAGVEPNCLLLSDSTGSYLLVFDDAAMRQDAQVGRKVTVVGRAAEGMMSTCQQGTPFVVTSIRAA
ncbi:hypothetical protein Ade02nite_41090 [Paractinoplanes deccanensis]|uniref:Uncharacterized protein n=1 Tax=Paractinoplanes deccanensis TaxID=113561 RepID=A0ABQ3Y659_9ACTN|nr:hypothetical protein [Actinoplanes deccanensis]GID75468.1 hypothetical protein Ade02nite_41090 [Actinoplanes deccanensis]